MEDYHVLSQEECEILASAMQGKISKLPRECKQYVGAGRQAAKPETSSAKKDANIAFEGMSPGEAAAGKSARAKGRATQAVIQRRYTTHTHKPQQDK